MKQILTAIFLFSMTSFVFGQSDIQPCGSTLYSMVFVPTEIKSLDELPTNIRARLVQHLKSSLGEEFYSLISFKTGLFIDYSELVKADPKVLKYQWEVPTYDIGFYLSQPNSGIEFYCSRITLDSLGNVVDDIRFPSIDKNSSASNFSSLERIKQTATENGFPLEDYKVVFSENHLVLVFARATKDKYGEELLVSAHTAEVVKLKHDKGIIDYWK